MAKGKKKKKGYKPLKNVLSTDLALVQASTLLDEAAQVAIKNNDVKAMQRVSRSWLEVGAVINSLSSTTPEQGEEYVDVTSETQIGFRGSLSELDEEEEEEYIEEGRIGFRGGK